MRDPDTGATPKQQAFALEYLQNGGNGVQAALQTYDTEDYNVAAAISSQNLNKLNVRDQLKKLAEQQGLTPSKIYLTVNRAMEADKAIQDSQGQIIASLPDHSTRLKAAELGSKLIGVAEDIQRRSGTGGSRHLHLHAGTLDDSRLDSLLGSGAGKGPGKRRSR